MAGNFDESISRLISQGFDVQYVIEDNDPTHAVKEETAGEQLVHQGGETRCHTGIQDIVEKTISDVQNENNAKSEGVTLYTIENVEDSTGSPTEFMMMRNEDLNRCKVAQDKTQVTATSSQHRLEVTLVNSGDLNSAQVTLVKAEDGLQQVTASLSSEPKDDFEGGMADDGQNMDITCIKEEPDNVSEMLCSDNIGEESGNISSNKFVGKDYDTSKTLPSKSNLLKKEELSNSIKTELNLEGTEIQCETCGLVFPDLQELKLHAKYCAQSDLQGEGVEVPELHLSSAEEPGDDIEEYVLDNTSNQNLMKLPRVKLKKLAECSICKLVFASHKELFDHVKSMHRHSVDTGCVDCGKTFACKKNLRKHRRKVHKEGPKKNMCHKCRVEFETLFMLEEHKQNDANCIKCRICAEGFDKSQLLITHLSSVHSENRRYKCTQCPATYNTRRNVDTHMRTHTGERPYVCSHCSMAFNATQTLSKHMKTHTKEYSFLCEVCSKKFMDKSALLRHGRVHTGEKPYKCHLCPSAHSTRSALKIHIRTHTGEKPYMCSECGRGYIAYSCLKIHMLSRHGLSLKINKYEGKS